MPTPLDLRSNVSSVFENILNEIETLGEIGEAANAEIDFDLGHEIWFLTSTLKNALKAHSGICDRKIDFGDDSSPAPEHFDKAS